MFELIRKECEARHDLFEYFGYREDWRILPFDDSTHYFWFVDEESGVVGYANTEAELKAETGDYYESDIYTQRHLPKWVYRGKDYTMILTDPHVDMNQFLQIFSNEKERQRGK